MSVSISSKRYAQAVFQIAKDRNELDKWKSNLSQIALLTQNPEFAAVIQNLPSNADRHVSVVKRHPRLELRQHCGRRSFVLARAEPQQVFPYRSIAAFRQYP